MTFFRLAKQINLWSKKLLFLFASLSAFKLLLGFILIFLAMVALAIHSKSDLSAFRPFSKRVKGCATFEELKAVFVLLQLNRLCERYKNGF